MNTSMLESISTFLYKRSISFRITLMSLKKSYYNQIHGFRLVDSSPWSLIAASESAVGLAIVIMYYRVSGSISIDRIPILKD